MDDQQRGYEEEHFNDIRTLYEQFKPERRIMFYDVEDGKLFTFPYKEYEKTLRKRSRIRHPSFLGLHFYLIPAKNEIFQLWRTCRLELMGSSVIPHISST